MATHYGIKPPLDQRQSTGNPRHTRSDSPPKTAVIDLHEKTPRRRLHEDGITILSKYADFVRFRIPVDD